MHRIALLDINSSGTLNVNEWGDLGRRFGAFVAKLRAWGLDIVFVAHMDEVQRGDVTVDRIQASGNISKNLVYQKSDFIGRISLDANKRRILDFNPSNTSFGKNVGTGIPTLALTAPSANMEDLARIIAQGKVLMNQSAQMEQQAAKAQTDFRAVFEAFTNVQQFNAAVAEYANADAVTKRMLVEVGMAKGLLFDKAAKTFSLPPQAAPAPVVGQHQWNLRRYHP